MTYVIGAIAGLILGGIVGFIKNRFIWGSYLRRDDQDAASGEAAALYSRMLGSNMINLVTLIAVFFLRNLVPFDGIAFLIGTAVTLALMNRVLQAGQKKNTQR